MNEQNLQRNYRKKILKKCKKIFKNTKIAGQNLLQQIEIFLP